MNDDLIRKHYNTARSLAHQLRVPTDAADFDDLVQEGAVAAWQATEAEERRDPVTYGMVVAKRRILGTLRGKHPMYGSEREGGRVYDQFRQGDKREVVESLVDKAWRHDAFLDIERRIDVERALGHLEPRDQEIVRLVGQGATWAEVADAVDMSQHGVFNRWRRILKPELQARLSVVRAVA